ncbi:hypothetical protein GQ53DRAFT_817728 [Thozetella sp. PMI_491]|nr:hypothetical protein GQ53DRAFT_817728 [Thozetella sp. PMI_491]
MASLESENFPRPVNGWTEEFRDQPRINYKTENNSIEAGRIKVEKQSGAEVPTLPHFFKITDDNPEKAYQVEQIEAICSEEDLKFLRGNGELSSPQAAAWLFEIGRAGGQMRFRPYPSPLGALQLQNALQNKRFRDCQETEAADLPDAERRLIYITDLDAGMVGAIILTSSRRFAWAMQNFLFYHLTMRPLITVRVKVDAIPVFSMEFHLPFNVLRRRSSLREDKRIKANGDPLRRSKVLTFLKAPADTSEFQDCIYEACVSCVVTGYNDVVWTALLAVDTYFSEDGKTKDRVVDFGADQDFPSDPLLAGDTHHEPGESISDPRLYFITVFANWVRRVRDEWKQISFVLEEAVRDYKQRHPFPLSPSGSSLGCAADLAEDLQQRFIWTEELDELVSSLSTELTTTIGTWGLAEPKFTSRYFMEGPGHDVTQKLCFHHREIQQCYKDLEQHRLELDQTHSRVKLFRKKLQLFLSMHGTHGIVLQQWNITLIVILSPPTLAAGLLQAGVINMEQQAIGFVLTTFVIAVAIWAIRPALTWASKRKEPVALAGLQAFIRERPERFTEAYCSIQLPPRIYRPEAYLPR